MNRREALSLAALVSETAPWAESIDAFPVRPAEQSFPADHSKHKRQNK